MTLTRRDLIHATGALLAGAATPWAHAADPVTLRFSWWGGAERHQLTLKAIEAFEANHPGIKIKAEYSGFGGYLERLTTQMAGGSEPDVLQCDWGWLPMFSRDGNGFADLHALRHRLALDQFAPDALRMGMVGGKLNALPASFTARVFVWNRSAFDKAGLSLPQTWEELFALGPKVRAKLGDKAFVLDGDNYDLLLLAHSYAYQKHGQPYLSPTEPKVAMSAAGLREWVAAYKRLSRDNVCVPVPYRTALGGPDKPTEQQPDWVNGNWLGYCAWDSATRLRVGALAPGQVAEIGPYLTLPDAKASGLFARAAMVFAISKRAKNPEAAATFLNYLLTSEDAAKILVNTRGVPLASTPLKQLLREGRMGPAELQAFQQIKTQREAGRIPAASPYFENPRLQQLMRNVFEQVAYDRIGEAEAVQRLTQEGGQVLSRLRT
ncbi:ABC transporter substrate-binding protein [Ideonella livida]|uniref:Carbohydrate ABC transporter substrate-binding protein n=1 Tax=Ideonella livida TaxID=2707176 RepID=A0A7C9TM48_9BURK|nr:ABC transporter substrate-binding protein [Ideonella livida]NDY93999.1 carbohydrate ABC transporter substrate-binding protein [Ideonella livida]